jgi:hypothetical protein
MREPITYSINRGEFLHTYVLLPTKTAGMESVLSFEHLSTVSFYQICNQQVNQSFYPDWNVTSLLDLSNCNIHTGMESVTDLSILNTYLLAPHFKFETNRSIRTSILQITTLLQFLPSVKT